MLLSLRVKTRMFVGALSLCMRVGALLFVCFFCVCVVMCVCEYAWANVRTWLCMYACALVCVCDQDGAS